MQIRAKLGSTCNELEYVDGTDARAAWNSFDQSSSEWLPSSISTRIVDVDATHSPSTTTWGVISWLFRFAAAPAAAAILI